jgi:multidrug efflux pump
MPTATGAAMFVDVDRDTAARLGISASTIDEALYSAFGQRIVSTIFTETNQYRVVLEARPDLGATPDALAGIQIKTSSGDPTPLSAVARITRAAGAAADQPRGAVPGRDHRLRHRAGVALGTAVDDIRAVAEDEMKLPAAVTMTFLGASGAYETRCRTSSG